jgi:hypothetical protein
MKEITEYRTKLLDELLASASEFRKACLAVRDPFQPVEEEGWSVHQIATHVRDVDRLVYGLRAKRTAEEDNPEFANFDGEAYAREFYSRDESLEKMLDGFVQSVESQVDTLRNLTPAAWSRVSRHEKLGANLTLQLWVERNLAHIHEHLETVRKAK